MLSLKHWFRKPLQFLFLVMGLSLATALWSSIQLLNSQAKNSYEDAVKILTAYENEIIISKKNKLIPIKSFAKLRRAGWSITPILEGTLPSKSSIVVMGIEPITMQEGNNIINALLDERQNFEELNTLFRYTLDRHFPEIKESKNQALELLTKLIERQCDLVVNWMRVGFIHGVMNTDNMSIAGETIDYGPCAFMDIYDPKTVFSSIDKLGRYAYCNQPVITKWNLSRFAECLIPLIDKDQDTAVKLATEIIDTFEKTYEEKWLNMMRAKLGLIGSDKKDKYLILDLLTWMHQNKVDYTNTFCHLMNFKTQKDNIYEGADFSNWKKRWQERSSSHDNSKEKHKKLMRSTNPLLIPRNHIVENTLRDADQGNLEPLLNFLKILNSPYTDQKDISEYQILSSSNENYQTFCGT